MLTNLSIRNIVLIERCDIPMSPGLCVLTGETGAGKSILLDALGLALGARSDAALIRRGEEQAQVTAEFDIAQNTPAKEAMAELGLEPAESLIIRRSLSADGKTRCFANDAPISVTGLKKLGESLVEVHGQHDQRGLMDASTHRRILDEYGGHHALLKEVESRYRALQDTRQALSTLEESLERARKEEEYLRHMAGELKALSPQPGEEETLALTRAEMMQSEKRFAAIDDALKELSRDKGAASNLRSAQRVLLRSTQAQGAFSAAIDALERAANEADEAQSLLESLARDTAFDPRTLEKMEERLFALKAAARKYSTTADGLSALYEETQTKLKTLDSRERELSALHKALHEAKEAYTQAAARLSDARAKTAKKLEKNIHAELEPLKMGGTRIRAALNPLSETAWGAHGMESVAFEAATNAAKTGEAAFSPLHKIASGGELSRFMLALKVALSEKRSTPTLIFDEIDTGTGGAVADAIGQRLGKLGARAQVLVVTHLPQVAARGSQHLRISKADGKTGVTTRVEPLDHEARGEEVARMLAGASVTAEARSAARKLLEDAV